MKKPKNKLLTTILFVAILTLSTIIVTIPLTSAHDPAWEIPSYAFVTASPDPVGVNQLVYVIMWVDWPLPSANMNNDIRRANYTLTITKPDGTNEIQEWPTISDTTGIKFFTYTPDQVGTYTLDFNYPGQIYTWNGAWKNDVFLASSASTTITVQEEQIPAAITSYPLPTDYWTRPIEGQNTDWWAISSHWLGSPQIQAEPYGRYQMDGSAPNSPHIMWTKPLQMGGVVGGTNVGPINGQIFYTGSNYDVTIESPLIMYGRFYYPLPLGTSSSGGGYMCIDLATGEEIWWQDMSAASFGQIMDYSVPNQHGALSGILWSTSGRGTQVWNGTDPLTGKPLLSITDVPSGEAVYGPNGEILRYVLDSEAKWLACWNTTAVFGTGAPGRNQPFPPEFNATTGYSWNITIPDLPAGDWSIQHGFYNDVVVCLQGDLGGRTSRGAIIESSGANITVISINESTLGQVLWTKHFPAPDAVYREMGAMDPVNRVFILRDKETMNMWAYSLDTGNLLWGPITQSSSGWDYFHASSYTYAVYDNLYTAGMDGILECRNITTGEMKWTYGNGGEGNTTNSGLQTPFGNYPINIGAFADGKIYTFCFEHTADSPLYKGYTVRCIDAFTGEELWQIDSFVLAGGGGLRGTLYPSLAIADGYLVYLNGYDMQLYGIGKGPSAITVEAPLTGITKGSSVMVKGTVTDESPGSKAKGTPAISDEHMGDWMEYMFMQKPRPAGAIGVPVRIQVVDPNGEYAWIGTATSDSYGNYGYSFIPQIKGQYTIIATFDGSDSYYGSTSTTYIIVDPAPTEVNIAPLEGSVNEVKSTVNNLDNSVNELEGCVNDLETSVSELSTIESSVNSLQGSTNGFEASLGNLESSIANQTTFILAILALVIISIVIAAYAVIKTRK